MSWEASSPSRKAEGQRLEIKRLVSLRKNDARRAKAVLRAERERLLGCSRKRHELMSQVDQLESMVRSLRDCRGLTLDQILTLHATCVDAVNPYYQT